MARRVVRTPTKVVVDLDARKRRSQGRRRRTHRHRPAGRSSAVAASADLDVSSATVRSEMVALEREGYLAQPHTSAGGSRPTRAIATSWTICSPASSAGPATAGEGVLRQRARRGRRGPGTDLDAVSQMRATLGRRRRIARARHDLERAVGEPRCAPPPSGHRVLRRFGRQAQSHAELRGDAKEVMEASRQLNRCSSIRRSRRGCRYRRAATTKPT